VLNAAVYQTGAGPSRQTPSHLAACRYNVEPNSPAESILFLKSLEISGFKSFARPTRLEFTEGITALVGPNGSGKSNVVDAIRWCLGEQSVRDLRGQTAQDVIYAGPRRALGMAEVRLYFERSATDGPDVPGDLSVARRLYRSGESEYLIDGRKVRLRDLADVLRSIGIDDSEYVVVNQGMADALLAASPMDRRTLLEQAAGLAGYRTRRDEAKSKLSTTRRNVETIETLLAEMEPRLRMLRRQAKAVQERDEARARLRVRLEAWLVHRWTALTDEIITLERERVVVEGQRREATAEVDRLEVQAEALLGAQRAWQERSNVVEAAFHLAERDRDAARHALASAGQRLEGTRASLAERTARLQEALQVTDAATAGIGKIDEELQGLRNRIAAADVEISRREATHRAARERLDAATRDAADRAQVLRSAHAEHARAAAVLEGRRHRLSEDEGRVRSIDGWLRDAAAKLQSATADAEARAVAQRTAEEELAVRRVALQDASQSAEVASDRLRRVDRLRARARGAADEVQRLLASARRTIEALQPLVGDAPIARLAVQEGKEEAVVAALAGWDGSALTCDLDAFLSWRAAFERSVAQTLTWADATASGIDGATPLHGALIVPTEADARNLWAAIAHRPACTLGAPPIVIVTVDGVRVGALGSSHPDADATGARFLRARAQVEGATQRSMETVRRVEQLEAYRSTLQAECAMLAGRAGTLRGEVDGLQRRSSALAIEAERATRALTSLTGDIEGRSAERGRLVQNADAVRGQAEAATVALASVAEQLRLANEAASGDDAALREARVQVDTALSRLTELRRERDTLAARQAAQTGLRASLERDRMRSEADRARLEAELGGLREREAALVEETTGLRVQHDGAERRLAGETERRAAVRGERLAETLPRSAVGDARRRLAEIIPRHERVVARLEARRTDRDALHEEIVRELTLQPEVLSAPDGDVPTAEEIQRLRNRASQYPDADASVIVEARELQERYTYLRDHAQDLRSAAENLHEIMNVADREMRGRFGGAFGAVNDEFARVFRVMLRGGVAELVLNDDGGVDIQAQLPGKKARSSAAFSGGERSLIASSLLFGVLRIRPTPFCVLDEVDAALDESNVDRYLSALRDISRRTQAIVVTHNRATMAASDTLYGTTMDDEGVTSLLSLRLETYAAG
jgi:chromosome segregation protein